MDDIRAQTIIPTGVRPPELVGLTRPKPRRLFPVLVAIAGVAVMILALLYAEGTFKAQLGGAQSLIVGKCFGTQTFLCSNPSLSNSTGQISFQFGQVTSQPIYGTSLACVSGSAVANYTLNFTPITKLGYTSTTLQNGVQISITNETCYGPSGKPLGATAKGTVFDGTIWVLYQQTVQSTGQIVKAATVSVAAS
ncbi:MAG: hypothetical protein KGH60_03425 [Candidatus Micrarchaeota archaeon]|nr:hypothetical protein [Candidatus Micrarchaeota archaeon]